MWEEDQVLCQLLTPETLDIVYSIFNQPEKAKDEPFVGTESTSEIWV